MPRLCLSVGLLALIVSAMAPPIASAQPSVSTETILSSFGEPDYEIWQPNSLILATDGNLYGATISGGANYWGTVFKTTSAGTTTIQYSFVFTNSSTDGYEPNSIIEAKDGNFYGTTINGGGNYSNGTVYELTSSGSESILYPFYYAVGSTVGWFPNSVIQGADGNFYGTTNAGGAVDVGNPQSEGYGTAFRVTPAGAETTLHVFNDGTVTGDGQFPKSPLLLASDGNFYGTTQYGGSTSSVSYSGTGYGTVFNMTPSGTVTILHSFSDGTVANDGQYPYAGLVQAPNGVLYGCTTEGGAGSAGTIFSITTSGVVTILHSFRDGSVANDGDFPATGLVLGSDENFYGVTQEGGATYASASTPGYGTAFRMTPAGTVTILHSFGDGTVANDGMNPTVLIRGTNGTFYGATASGGINTGGTVFALTPALAPPAGLTAKAGMSKVSLAWSPASGATSYDVYRGTAPGAESSTPAAVGVASPAFTDTAVTNGVKYYYKVAAVNGTGTSPQSNEASATPTASSVTFVKTDATTEGSWKGVYGGAGFNLIGDPEAGNPHYPTNAAVSATGSKQVLWTNASTAASCLQAAAAGNVNRLAGAWYAPTAFTIDLNVTGSAGSTVALYFLDGVVSLPGGDGRAETVTIADEASHTVLDTRTVTGFGGGVYEVWTITGHVTIAIERTAGSSAVLSGIFFGPGSVGGQSPSTPAGLKAGSGVDKITLSWTASVGAKTYNLYRSTVSMGEGSVAYKSGLTGTTYTDTSLTAGDTYYYQVMAVNAVGGSPASAEVHAADYPTAATFVKTDDTTQGSWKGKYGLQGYNIIEDPSPDNPHYPAYAAVTESGNSSVSWTGDSTAAYALQAAAVGSTNRLAGAWSASSSFSVDVSLSDGNSHPLALYVLDWKAAGRTETITITDAHTHAVLDTRTATTFAGGVYYVWDIKGDVTVKIAKTDGPNAVVSGLFLD